MKIVNRFLVILVFAALLIGTAAIPSFAAQEETFTCGDYEYVILEDGTAEITKYLGSDAYLEIPAKLDGIQVTSLGVDAFYECTDIYSMVIPDGVTNIGWGAISSCESLTEIEIPATVTSFGDFAFSACVSLSSFVVPEGVTSIGQAAFEWCTNLTSVVIPDSYTGSLVRTFEFCENLRNVELPDSLTSIGRRVFYNCTSLSSIELPEGVTTIEEYAFGFCGRLSDIELPKTVESIGNHAFEWCTSLSEIEIPENVTSIGNHAFTGCKGLTQVTIPAGVTSIGEKAFGYEEYYNDNEYWYLQSTDFVISGHDNSEAKRYADENGFTFINLDSPYADYSKIEAVKAKVPDDLTIYTEESVNALSEAIEAVQEGLENTEQATVDNWAAAIEEAIEGLEEKPADYMKVYIAQALVPKDLTIYTDKSVAELKKALDAVEEGKTISEQETVDGWAESIEKAILALVKKPEKLFRDVQDPGAWFYEYVYTIAGTTNKYGTPLMSGYKDGSNRFGPADPLTRQDFAVILYRLAEEPDVTVKENPFPDADPKGYYFESIVWAKENGIIGGYEDGRFGVGDNITREQVATILYRYAKDLLKLDTETAKAEGNLKIFKDYKSVSSFATDALAWANGAGIITGKDNGTRIDPQGNAARAEIGAMVLRFQNYLGK